MIHKIRLPFKVKKPILACGTDMKGAFALAKGNEAFLVDGFGDLSQLANFTEYSKSIKYYVKKLKIDPRIVTCDMHQGYLSTHFVQDLRLVGHGLYLCRTQHHEAHVAGTMADNNIKADVIGVAFDGTGLGMDENIWGGEFFVGNIKDFKRAAHIKYMPMPGGEIAIRKPWRMAASYLYNIFGEEFLNFNLDFVKGINKKKWAVLKKMIDRKLNSPLTSSVGRLFDAAGSIILPRNCIAAEAELPRELESMCIKTCRGKYGFSINSRNGALEIDCGKAIKGVVLDLSNGVSKFEIATKFHNTVADIILKTSVILRKKFRIDKVVLSGGVFQNEFLTSRAKKLLEIEGFEVYSSINIPVSDAGIPVGQVAIANMRATCV